MYSTQMFLLHKFYQIHTFITNLQQKWRVLLLDGTKKTRKPKVRDETSHPSL